MFDDFDETAFSVYVEGDEEDRNDDSAKYEIELDDDMESDYDTNSK
jgi:hypothetical protein